MQLNLAFASLYQCDSGSVGPESYRGTIAIPFFANKTTFAALYSGLEFRLNRYSQAHVPVPSQPLSLDDAHGLARSKLNPLASYFCTFCNDSQNSESIVKATSGPGCPVSQTILETDVHVDTSEYEPSVVRGTLSSYPALSVELITRRLSFAAVSSSVSGNQHDVAEVDDEQALVSQYQSSLVARQGGSRSPFAPAPFPPSDNLMLPRDHLATLTDEVQHLNVFFHTRIINGVVESQQATDLDEEPCVTEDGMTHRIDVSQDHCPLFVCDPKPLDVAVEVRWPNGASQHLKCRFAAFHSCRDLMIRLEHLIGAPLLRLFDLHSGASILPCEALGHIIWKFHGRLAADVYPAPDVVPRKWCQLKCTQDTIDLSGTPIVAANRQKRSRSETPELESKRRQRVGGRGQHLMWSDMVSMSDDDGGVFDDGDDDGSEALEVGPHEYWDLNSSVSTTSLRTGDAKEQRSQQDSGGNFKRIPPSSADSENSSIRLSSVASVCGIDASQMDPLMLEEPKRVDFSASTSNRSSVLRDDGRDDGAQREQSVPSNASRLDSELDQRTTSDIYPVAADADRFSQTPERDAMPQTSQCWFSQVEYAHPTAIGDFDELDSDFV